jgi:hypothetical protein
MGTITDFYPFQVGTYGAASQPRRRNFSFFISGLAGFSETAEFPWNLR